MRNGRRNIQGRYIEAIPGLAMMGECYWQMGNLPAVRELSDQIIQIVNRHRFLGGVQWKGALEPGVVAKRAYLWPDAAAVQVTPFRDRIPITSGAPVTEGRLLAGGPIESLNLRNMDIGEIMRGIAIASYRRRVLLGPLSENDPGAQLLLDSTKYPSTMPLPIGRTMIGAVRSVGYFGSLDDARTITDATTKGFYSGTAHPLSGITLLAATNALAGSKNPQATIPAAMRTVHTLGALGQLEFLGDAMQLAAGCATPQLAPAIADSASVIASALLRESRLATLHCLIAGADASITAGNLDMAAKMLNNAETIANRRDVTVPRVAAYGAYVRARLAAASGSSLGSIQSTPLDKALVPVFGFALNNRSRRQMLVSMPRVYQYGLIRQAMGKSLGDNSGDKLLQAYCEDPPVEVWRRDPIDGLAGAMVDRTAAHATRISLAAAAGYGEKLLQAVDLMLASRFNSQLPLGGRVAQVRAISRADEKSLPPGLVELRNKPGNPINDVRAAVAAPGKPTLDRIAMTEAKACAAALGRIHLPQITLPTLDPKAPIAKLPTKTGLLTFTSVGNRVLATLSTNGRVVMWTVAGSNRLPTEIAKVLKGIGVGKTRGERIPQDEAWKTDAIALRRHLLPDDSTITAEKFDELIIVPDGALWYLPFEILPLFEADSPLIGDSIKIRYVATPALALKPVTESVPNRRVGIATGKFFAPRDPDLNQQIVDSIVEVLNDPLQLPDANQTPTALLGHEIGHLAVAAPQTPNTKNFLLTSMAPYEQTSPLGNLAAWLRFPARVPSSVVLAGFRTPMGVGRMGDGNEIFNTLCALNVSGVRNVLISRWAVGGESTAIVLREFLQELPFTGMNEAWKRAQMVLRGTELDPAGEPLLIQAEHEREGLTGDQPLFWSGYLISSPSGHASNAPPANPPAAAQN